jgi:signal transduction histidine kinase/iron only hydrogenase large subunit-like protein
MNLDPHISFIRTNRERCRVCYTCVRECPAKAIRIMVGQAEVMPERCIACGNCVRVCSQRAKEVLSSIERVKELLNGPTPVAACVAPSFPVEFVEIDYSIMVGMLRSLGFQWVHEVAFGADLVARRYREILSEDKNKRFIASTCPSIVGFVEKYHPELVDSLMPVASPMVAMARVARQLHGQEAKVVFIGPCIAKKSEGAGKHEDGEVDAVLTFSELRLMFNERNFRPEMLTPSDFDPPHAGLGALFPISRGLLQSAFLDEDLMQGEVVATDGRVNFIPAIREFESGALDARFLEVLACQGCLMGAGTTTEEPLFRRRSYVSRYVRGKIKSLDQKQWLADLERFAGLDLSQTFQPNDQRIPVPFQEEISLIMMKMGKYMPADELNCGACGYDTCREHAEAIFKGLAESEMCLPHTIEKLRQTVQDLATSKDRLASTQEALMQSEKLASMGQLAAGIAHEVNNPLGVVIMYAHLLLEQCAENQQIREDAAMIAEQADRCKKIVAGLLHFARQNKVGLEEVDIDEFISRVLKTVAIPEGVDVQVEHQTDLPAPQMDPDQMVQVLVNLINNAFAAMPDGGKLYIRTGGDSDRLTIEIADTGMGIPYENLPKLFEPFFTTKKIGLGTGLGLAVAYGIVKMHCGDIRVTSNADASQGPTGTTFTISLPRKGKRNDA